MRTPPPVNLPEPLEVTRAKLALVEDRLRRYRAILVALQATERATRRLLEARNDAELALAIWRGAPWLAVDGRLTDAGLLTFDELEGLCRALTHDAIDAAKASARELRSRLMVAIQTERVNRWRLRRRIREREGAGA